MTVEALSEIDGITSREAERSKNFFALGLMAWLFHRPTEGTIQFIQDKFGKRPSIAEANTRAFKAGWNYGETSEDFAVSYEIAPAQLRPAPTGRSPGTPRSRSGSSRRRSSPGLDLFLGAYPITPASSILEDLAVAQGVRRDHLPGRGRDRGGRRRGRGVVRRRARRDRLVGPRASCSRPRRSGWPCRSSCRSS